MGKYYNCDYLLTLKDRNGKTPDIYIADGNRTAGKTVSFKRRLIDTFLKEKTDVNQFYLIYRYKTDMQSMSDSFFTDIRRLFYNGHVMTEKKLFDGAVVQLLLDDKPCGWCLPLSLSGKIKRMSSIFVQVAHGFFDEYQDESDNYLPNEIDKLMSIHTSIARGDGEQTRRVPLYMASNTVSILNPYYQALGINKMLKRDTKILRGDGWVYERTYNESASKAFESSAFNRAFSESKYFSHAAQNVYLNDNVALIARPSGASEYMLSIRYNGMWYNVRRYNSCGYIYVSEGADETYPRRVCFNYTDVVDDRAVMVNSSNYIIIALRNYFHRGFMRFQNLACKNMMFDMLSFL